MIALQLKANKELIESIEAFLPELVAKMCGEKPGKFVVARNARIMAKPDEQPEQVHAPTLAYVALKAMQAKAREAMENGKRGFEQIISFDAAVCVQIELKAYRAALAKQDAEAEPGVMPSLKFGPLHDVLKQVTRYVELVERMDREHKRADTVRRHSGTLRRHKKVSRRA